MAFIWNQTLIRVRLYAICTCLSLFCLVPLEAENYYANNAYLTLQNFLRNGIVTDTGTDPSGNTMRFLWSFYVTLEPLGMVCGALLTPLITNRLGRPASALFALMVFAVPARIIQLLSPLPHAWWLMFVGHYFGCVGSGVITVVLPVLASEIAPAEIRGRVGLLPPLGHSAGAILGTVLGLKYVLGDADTWWYSYLVFIGLLLPSIPLLLLIPESPTLLIARNNKRKLSLAIESSSSAEESGCVNDEIEEERASLERMDKVCSSLLFYQGGTENLSNVAKDAEILSMQENEGSSSVLSVIREPSLRSQLFLAFMISNLYFPVVVMQSYSTLMMEAVGIDQETAEYSTLGLKLLSFAAFVCCIVIADRVGRKKQLLLGTAFTMVALGLMCLFHFFTLSYGAGDGNGVWPIAFTVSLYALQLFLNFGIRPLYWVIVPEIFPFKYRAAGKSLINALAGILIVAADFLFYTMIYYITYWTYLILAVPIAVSFGYLLIRFPETSRRQLFEIFEGFLEDDSSATDQQKLAAVPGGPNADEGKPLITAKTANGQLYSSDNGTKTLPNGDDKKEFLVF